MDDDDSYLYGEPSVEEPVTSTVQTSVPQPISVEQTRSMSQGLVAKLEEQVADDEENDNVEDQDEDEPTENGGEEEDEDDDSEDDVEIIMETQSRSLDFRQKTAGPRPTSSTFTTPQRAPPPPQPSLTTEYTPRERGGIAKISSTPQPSSQTPAPPLTATPGTTERLAEADKDAANDAGPDPNTLPPATAPPSHPSINPSLPGMLDGRSILEVDLGAVAEKPWRRSGSDISDWFNYGFDEISWEAYCYRRRELGELAGMLKNNVLNFSGMPEDQLIALPPEVRAMVMAGATAIMAGGGAGGPGGVGMIPPGAMNMNGSAMMNQMMNMGGMMNPMMEMGVGMGDMGMMPDGNGGNGGQGGGQGAPDGQVGMAMVGDGFGPGGAPGQGMMGMGMNPEFGMQDPTMGQQMYPGMEGSGTPVPVAPAPLRGATQGQFRGRGITQGVNMRGRGTGFAGRGRGMPLRPASPLPPNVPTGPRNKNKYKDIDGSAPAVDGLDYGGGGGGERDRSERSERAERKERGTPDLDERDRSSRKRRASPTEREEITRSSKRR